LGPPLMTIQGDRAEFVRRVWDHVVPTTGAQKYYLENWVPEELMEPLGRQVSRAELAKINLDDANTCAICFAKIHRFLNRNWSLLTPELASEIVRSLDELSLWEGFDRSKIRVSDAQRDVVKVRLDLADVVFAAKEKSFKQELQPQV
jgi:hypothetical protein